MKEKTIMIHRFLLLSPMSILKAVTMVIILEALIGCSSEGMYYLIAPKHRVDVILPERYEGPVLIAYQVSNGVVAEKQDNVWIYRIPQDGVLLLQNPPLRGVGQFMFFYQSLDGTLQPIPPSSCFDDAEDEGVVVCSTGHYEIYKSKRLRPLLGYFVGTLDHWRQFKTDFDYYNSLYERYFDMLALPEN